MKYARENVSFLLHITMNIYAFTPYKKSSKKSLKKLFWGRKATSLMLRSNFHSLIVGLLPPESRSFATQKLLHYKSILQPFYAKNVRFDGRNIAFFNTCSGKCNTFRLLSNSFILTFIRELVTSCWQIRRCRARIIMHFVHKCTYGGPCGWFLCWFLLCCGMYDVSMWARRDFLFFL